MTTDQSLDAYKRRATKAALYQLSKCSAALHEMDCYHDLNDPEAAKYQREAQRAFQQASHFLRRLEHVTA
jgi:hypothetical protein